MCFYYDHYCDVIHADVRKARYPHRCDACLRHTIVAGDWYCYVHGIDSKNAGAFGFKYCGACEVARERIYQHERSHGCDYDESWCPYEEIGEYFRDQKWDMPDRAAGQAYLAKKVIAEFTRKVENRLAALTM